MPFSAITRPVDDRSRVINNELQPWTAARCHRLLRQLQSRLMSLHVLVNETRTANGSTSDGPNVIDERERPRKRIRQTYGQRRTTAAPRARENLSATPPRSTRTLGAMKLDGSSPPSSQAVAPTPLWHRIREHPETPRGAKDDIDEAPTKLETPALSEDVASGLRSLKTMARPDRYRIYEAIVGWLAELLRITSGKADEPQRKSLMGMCLRKIPDCVSEIEAWDRQMSKEKGSGFTWKSTGVSLELYEQLESFGIPGRGWRPLKLVVRSHVMFLLSNAIRSGLLESPAAALLVKVCMDQGCTEEAGTLALAAGESMPFPSAVQANDSRLQGLRGILAQQEGRGHLSPAFDTLDRLIRERPWLLPCLSRRSLCNPWLLSLRAIMTGRSSSSAMELLSTTMAMLAGNHQQSQSTYQQEHLLIGVAGAVVAAAMALSSGDGRCGQASRLRRQRRLLHVLDRGMAQAQLSNHRRRQARRSGGLFVLAFARQLTADNIDDPSLTVFKVQAAADTFQLAGKSGDLLTTQYRQITSLACSIAQFRSRTLRVPGRESLEEICDRIEALGLAAGLKPCLRTDAAFLLAQRTKDLGDLAFAESLPAGDQGGRNTALFSGWRWEEGISEWVQLDSTKTGDDGQTMGSPGEQQPNSSRSTSMVRGNGLGDDNARRGRLRRPRASEGQGTDSGTMPLSTKEVDEAGSRLMDSDTGCGQGTRGGRRRAMTDVDTNTRALKRKSGENGASWAYMIGGGYKEDMLSAPGLSEACRLQRTGEKDGRAKVVVSRAMSSLGPLSRRPMAGSEWDECDELS
ncbi:hypothetical protein B0I35DRAFT_434740 [Stachybotrys elegans]|uniref:Uncharacterized protein n=1 Tax=Stachybotrys elegans TaxID=80388 RepID=A0A8K0WNR4_9HYPO|nr:hypothetical protein B0I35DRAFT_434740 [Stachybotrys elegans]